MPESDYGQVKNWLTSNNMNAKSHKIYGLIQNNRHLKPDNRGGPVQERRENMVKITYINWLKNLEGNNPMLFQFKST